MKNAAIEKRQQRSEAERAPERTGEGVWYTPLCDIVENDEAFWFQADLPGVAAEDLDISYENGTLTIDGKARLRQEAGTRYGWREYGVGHFHRSFSINTPVNVEGIRAELKNGELSLYVPKAESAKPKRIKVQGG